MSQSTPDNDATILISNVLLFTGHQFLEDAWLYVKDGTVHSVGTNTPPVVAEDTIHLSKPNHTVIPGLIDAHIHASDGNIDALEQSLRFGVTTVFDMHNEHKNILKLRALATDPAKKFKYADFKYVGLGGTIEGGWPAAIITLHDKSEETRANLETWPNLDSTEKVKQYVQDQVEVGASAIKLFHESGTSLGLNLPLLRPEVQSAIVTAAHEKALLTIGHALTYADTMTLLDCGVDGLTHTFLDRGPTPELVAAYRRNKAHCMPTLATAGSLTREGRALQAQLAAHPLTKRLPLNQPASTENLCQCISMGVGLGAVANAYATVQSLRTAGVPLVVGSDSAGPAVGTAWGLSMHHELGLLVRECGMSVTEVLAAATSVTAERFGWRDRGVLEAGRKGDFVLLEGDIRGAFGKVGLLDLKGVWRDGIICVMWQ